MKLTDIFESADIERPPPTAFGGEVRVRNRAQMLATLAAHHRMQGIYIGLLFLTVLALVWGSLGLAISEAGKISKGLIPYLGGAMFLALLEFERRLVIMHNEEGLLMMMLRHASDEQLTAYIDVNLAVNRAKKMKQAPRGKSVTPSA